MKKTILALLLISVNLFTYAQTTETINIYEGKVEKFKIDHFIKNGTDTLTYFWYGFQNKEYSHIIDIGSIIYSEKKDLILFVNTLKDLANRSSDSNYSVTLPRNYKLYIYSFNKHQIYLEDDKGKYTTFLKNDVFKLAEEIEKFIYLLK